MFEYKQTLSTKAQTVSYSFANEFKYSLSFNIDF